MKNQNLLLITIFLLVALTMQVNDTQAKSNLTAEDFFKIKKCSEICLSPNGQWVAYTVAIQRKANEDPGQEYKELYIISTDVGKAQALLTGKIRILSPLWNPKANEIAFMMRQNKGDNMQVWLLSTDEGSKPIRITDSETDIMEFKWHPSGEKIAYIAKTPLSNKEKILRGKGYNFIYYEENLKHKNLYITEINRGGNPGPAKQLTKDITIWDFEFGPMGNYIAATASEKNLVDQEYMFRKIYLLDLKNLIFNRVSNNPGKLGNYAFSPDGSKIAYVGGIARNDHKQSQVYVMNSSGGNAKNLTIPNFVGHVNWVGWKDNRTILYCSGEGTLMTLRTVDIINQKRNIILDSDNLGIIFKEPRYSKNSDKYFFIGDAYNIPGDVYCWEKGQGLKRLTNVNLWLSERLLGNQKVLKYSARDGMEIEGILIHPVGYDSKKHYPLIVYVHGGPESHYSNGWISSNTRPGQVMAGKGYVVFYPNYRASTGYGVKFGVEGYGDPAGKEFDDIADGITYLISEGLADSERVGMAGGSYGGYASAWFATYYTKYVKAVCMAVGISDLISKRGTTDIPYEVLYVHYGNKLEDMWELSLKRSPIYWAHQSKTAVLIYGGTEDTRVHPSQSIELFRRLKMNNHPAVRLVQYPGEKHGNKNQPAIIDFLYRQILWFDWYVMENKQLDGPMPPRDISMYYGIDLVE